MPIRPILGPKRPNGTLRTPPAKPGKKYLLVKDRFSAVALTLILSLTAISGLSVLYIWNLAHHQSSTPFPVSVNPETKTIIEDSTIDAQLAQLDNPFMAAAGQVADVLGMAAATVTSTVLPNKRIVTIYPGYRREQVVDAFGKEMDWSDVEKEAFLTSAEQEAPPIHEGQFAPGIYVLDATTSDATIRSEIADRFQRDILSRYPKPSNTHIPLEQALTIASIIQRETHKTSEMRTISGIIWNRIFDGTKLQMDATLQYAKGNPSNGWWPQVRPVDKYIESPYNTYQNVGLPPAPISSPSPAAVIAALNPKKTSCIFYFHDSNGAFHCSATYTQHVALLKKYFGRGK